MTSLNRAILLASIALVTGSAGAADVREVMVPDNVGVAIEPAHSAHVLGDAVRDTQIKRSPTQWTVTEPSRMRALMPADEARLNAEDASAAEEARHTRTTIYFDFDKSHPLAWTPLINVMGEALHAGSTVTVTGYADEVGAAAYNQRLSEERAIDVARYLIKHGMQKKHIKVLGRGKRDPVSTVDSSKNRRVEVDIVKAQGGSR